MDVRERLVELFRNAFAAYGDGIAGCTREEFFADFIAGYGVTVQEWISVKDGMPKLIPSNAGTAYSEAVYVLTTGRKVLTAIWNGFDWICDAEFWDAEDEEITHWAPVFLPLPRPPKGK